MRIAAVLTWISGVGLGVSCVLCLRSLAAGRGIATVLGYPAFGQGPFEHHGFPTTVSLVAVFLVICLVECIAGALLWRGQRVGGVLALGVLPFGAVYWWGFALPYPPLLALARVAFIVSAWRMRG
jgi:hypothetical protein